MSDLAAGVREYLGALRAERGLSANTVAAYRRDLAEYRRFLERRALSPDPEAVAAFVAELHRRGLAPTTVARKISTLRGFHRFLVAEGLVAEDPTVLLVNPRRARALPKALTVEEVERLLATPEAGTRRGARDAALLEFLYGTGCRVSEAVGLELLDVDLEEGIVLLRGKGDRQRLVPLGRYARTAFERYLPVRRRLLGGGRDPGRVFLNLRGAPLSRQGIWYLVRRAAVAAGIPERRISPHVLRHSAATHMVEGGADLRTVQEFLGHASIGTTQVYTRVSPQHLLEVFVTSHPRST